jgi:hypothetical protein
MKSKSGFNSNASQQLNFPYRGICMTRIVSRRENSVYHAPPSALSDAPLSSDAGALF